jgi:hypothetical protein
MAAAIASKPPSCERRNFMAISNPTWVTGEVITAQKLNQMNACILETATVTVDGTEFDEVMYVTDAIPFCLADIYLPAYIKMSSGDNETYINIMSIVDLGNISGDNPATVPSTSITFTETVHGYMASVGSTQILILPPNTQFVKGTGSTPE